MTREKRTKLIRHLRYNRSIGADYLITDEDADEIIKALEQQPRWIPMVEREPTDKEKAEHFDQHGEELCYMLENEMPLNGQEVLVSTKSGIYMDVFSEEFYNFEGIDIRDVIAWMPLPAPFEPQKSEGVSNE